jgi:hypothetical protein
MYRCSCQHFCCLDTAGYMDERPGNVIPPAAGLFDDKI